MNVYPVRPLARQPRSWPTSPALIDFIRERAAGATTTAAAGTARDDRTFPRRRLLLSAGDRAGRDRVHAEVQWHVAAIVSGFIALACTRMCVRADDVPALETARRRLVVLWSIILLTSFAWGAFSVWCFLRLPEPGPLVAVLFSGAFGMAMCHTLCMRRLPASIAILAFMLPCAALLWQTNGAGVAMMWLITWATCSSCSCVATANTARGSSSRRSCASTATVRDADAHRRTDRHRQPAPVRRCARACARTRRVGGEVSLLILDLDHFKQINGHGHLAGDACLVVVAGACRRISSSRRRAGTPRWRGVRGHLAGDLRTAERAERFRADPPPP